MTFRHRSALLLIATAITGGTAHAQSSTLTQNRVDRASAVTLDCVNVTTGLAIPCGTLLNPLVVTGGSTVAGGSASATNQQTQITAEQAISSAAGTQADALYGGSGNTTLVGVLKGVFSLLNGTLAVKETAALPSGSNVIGQVAPVAAPLVSRTITVAAGTSTTLFAANAARHYLSFQAPQNTGIWINRVGGTAAVNGADCAYFAPGALFESGNYVNSGVITVYSPNAVTISAWEG